MNEDQREQWRKAIAAARRKRRQQRDQRDAPRAIPFRPGMIRKLPPAAAANWTLRIEPDIGGRIGHGHGAR